MLLRPSWRIQASPIPSALYLVVKVLPGECLKEAASYTAGPSLVLLAEAAAIKALLL